jgi:hypothetical protein
MPATASSCNLRSEMRGGLLLNVQRAQHRPTIEVYGFTLDRDLCSHFHDANRPPPSLENALAAIPGIKFPMAPTLE